MDASGVDELSKGVAAVALDEVSTAKDVPPQPPPLKLSQRVRAADLVPQLMRDLDAVMATSPRIKLEAVRTLTRYIQGLLHAWTAEQKHPEFVLVISRYVKLLKEYRMIQSQQNGSTAEYSLMTNDEITDW